MTPNVVRAGEPSGRMTPARGKGCHVTINPSGPKAVRAHAVRVHGGPLFQWNEPGLVDSRPSPCPSVLIYQVDFTQRSLENRYHPGNLRPMEERPAGIFPSFYGLPLIAGAAEARAGKGYAPWLFILHISIEHKRDRDKRFIWEPGKTIFLTLNLRRIV